MHSLPQEQDKKEDRAEPQTRRGNVQVYRVQEDLRSVSLTGEDQRSLSLTKTAVEGMCKEHKVLLKDAGKYRFIEYRKIQDITPSQGRIKDLPYEDCC